MIARTQWSTWAGRTAISVAALVTALAGHPGRGVAFGQSIGLTALTTFGSNGWLAPGSNVYLDSVSGLQRGLAYNPVTKNVVLVSRTNTSVVGNTNNIVILNGTTGVVSGTLNPSGITGGTFPINMAGVDADGSVYVGNLALGGGPFKVYKWNSESTTSAPTVAFQWNVPSNSTTTSGTGAYRFGDAFDVYGSGASTRFAAAGTSTGTTGGLGTSFRNNANFLVGSTDLSNKFALYKGIVGTGTTTNNYRVSLSFVDQDTVMGTEGDWVRVTDYVTDNFATVTGTQQGPTNSTLISSIRSGSAALGGTTEYRVLDYLSMGGKQYLAILRTGNAGTGAGANAVNVYDISTQITQTTGTNPTLVATLDLTTTEFTNGNASGQVAWGDISIQDGFWFSAPLYVLNTNNGIQAMIFTVPEPSTWAMLATGVVASAGVFMRRRSRRRGGNRVAA